MDTQYRSLGNVPHMTQVNWSFNGRTNQGSIKLLINGHHYYKGRGNPGSASIDEYNNCLIDSICQCLGLECNRKLVRQDLERNYGCASGRAKVTEMSYLDVEHHAQDIIRSLCRHNTSGQQSECNIADFAPEFACCIMITVAFALKGEWAVSNFIDVLLTRNSWNNNSNSSRKYEN